MFTKKWLRVMIGIVVAFIALQFIAPKITNPPVTADVVASDSVKMVLRSSCYNCHSNEVQLKWFDKIAPASWLVARDVEKGRAAVNFSEWDKLSKDRQKGVLFEALNQMQFGTMPLHDYTMMHPTAKTGGKEIDIFKSYLATLMVTPVMDSGKTAAWDKQYQQWVTRKVNNLNVKPSLNGIPIDLGYRDWGVISSTVRTDNGTLKIIMGNDIAMRAAATSKTNPWPDGTSFAKLTWVQTVDKAGNICTGEFKQIAFMLKDAVKYRSTLGWGFSQWDKGLELATHGKTSLFTTDCVNCHKPMKATDYVFTIPSPPIGIDIRGLKLVGSSANSKTHTMSTLYGNDIATKAARSPGEHLYPAGSVLTLITWRQQEDIHWFGGNTPGPVQQVERVSFKEQKNREVLQEYEFYQGEALEKVAGLHIAEIKERILHITSQRASILP